MKTLTIGIPTYKRKDIIKELIAELNQFVVESDDFEVLVIDNASEDGTVEELKKISDHNANIRIMENEENLGFAGNFGRLFSEANGRYLLIMSDEDSLVKENIHELIALLIKTRPTFLSCQFIRDFGQGDFVYMGRKKNAKIKPSEFHPSSFYISGIIYSVKESRPLIKKIVSQQKDYVSAFIYPQALLSALLLVKYNNSYWFNRPIAREKYNNEPNFTMMDDTKYNSLSSRWIQYFGFIDYLFDFSKEELSQEQKRILTKLVEGHKRKLFYWLRWGVSTNNGAYLNYFDYGAKWFIIDQVKFLIRQCFNKIFRHDLYNKEVNATIPTKATWRLTRRG
jgi:glycosyltransferase involved in cell wall biosynthesis